MEIRFSKYHGTGNDFIVIDNLNRQLDLTRDQLKMLCDRHLGIGADGLMLLLPSQKFDFEMKYFNGDGGEGTMCGNGGRCITAFAYQIGLIRNTTRFTAIDGEHCGEILGSEENQMKIKVTLRDISQIKQDANYFLVNTGSPHYVEIMDDPDGIDIFQRGKSIRWDPRFAPEGLNVNFVKVDGDKLLVRTFERGVENITLSCGTGVTAAAVAADIHQGQPRNEYHIQTYGGNLKVQFVKDNKIYRHVSLTGPVQHVFNGTIELK